MTKLHGSNAVIVILKIHRRSRCGGKGPLNSRHFCLTDTSLLAIFTLTLRELISSWSFLTQFHDRELYPLGSRKVAPERRDELITAETKDRSVDWGVLSSEVTFLPSAGKPISDIESSGPRSCITEILTNGSISSLFTVTHHNSSVADSHLGKS